MWKVRRLEGRLDGRLLQRGLPGGGGTWAGPDSLAGGRAVEGRRRECQGQRSISRSAVAEDTDGTRELPLGLNEETGSPYDPLLGVLGGTCHPLPEDEEGAPGGGA